MTHIVITGTRELVGVTDSHISENEEKVMIIRDN